MEKTHGSPPKSAENGPKTARQRRDPTPDSGSLVVDAVVRQVQLVKRPGRRTDPYREHLCARARQPEWLEMGLKTSISARRQLEIVHFGAFQQLPSLL